MSTAADIRRQVESALAERIPAALSFRPHISAELLSCGLVEVDAVLGGGLPLGGITELTGAHSSGRTTLALATLSEITRQGESCAYVDVSDALNPISAAALGVDLRRLLWVRGGELRAGEPRREGTHATEADSPYPVAMPVQARVSQKLDEGWCHPRSEAVGMPRAVGQLFNTAHHTPHPDDFTPRCSESVRRERVRPVVFDPGIFAQKQISQTQPMQRPRNKRDISWTRLDQALRATDLLLSTGGFRAIVLDMGDVSPEQARRVPLATWYRFRLQVEKSRTLFILMTGVPCANSCAAVSLHCQQRAIHWQQAAMHSVHLLAGLRYRVGVERSRAVDPTRKKPAASAEAVWRSVTPWAR